MISNFNNNSTETLPLSESLKYVQHWVTFLPFCLPLSPSLFLKNSPFPKKRSCIKTQGNASAKAACTFGFAEGQKMHYINVQIQKHILYTYHPKWFRTKPWNPAVLFQDYLISFRVPTRHMAKHTKSNKNWYLKALIRYKKTLINFIVSNWFTVKINSKAVCWAIKPPTDQQSQLKQTRKKHNSWEI